MTHPIKKLLAFYSDSVMTGNEQNRDASPASLPLSPSCCGRGVNIPRSLHTSWVREPTVEMPADATASKGSEKRGSVKDCIVFPCQKAA